jgi:nitrogenase molybdenum-iron protein alpha/beta subunit
MTFDGTTRETADWGTLASERFDVPYRYPFHLGLFMAVNAIPGCYAVVDGPDCLYRKAEWIHGKHDLCSTLLDAAARHRIVPTMMHSGEVIKSTGEAVASRLRRVAQLPEADLMIVNSMPHVQIIGTQYDSIIAEVEVDVAQLIVEVPSRALEGDWLDGYAEVLNSLAARIPVGDELEPDSVAIIGLLMDRTEADHLANVAELERCVRALGLEPTSTWLSARPLAHLARAGRAQTLIALPHGRTAAERIAARTGAKVVTVAQPFGLRGTIRMIRALAQATGREQQAEAFIEAELRELLPRFEWFVPSVLLGRTLAFAGEPTLFDGLLDGAAELGLEVLYLAASARRPDHGCELDEEVHGRIPPVSFGAPRSSVARHFDQLEGRLDLYIGNSQAPPSLSHDVAHMEFGFPSFFRHALHETPFLGFRGWAWFVQEIGNTIMNRPRGRDQELA